MKNQLLARIDRERESLVGFLQEFIRCGTPNPPGDTTAAAGFLERWFAANGIAAEKVAPRAGCPDYIASFDPGRPRPQRRSAAERSAHGRDPAHRGAHGRVAFAG